MENLSDIRTVRTVMEKHGVSFSKALGQNFIINPSVCPKMADLCGTDENTGVIEIGGGVGVLTNELCKRSKKVVCVELDTRLLPVLADTLSEYDNFECVNADIMKIDLHELIREKFGDMSIESFSEFFFVKIFKSDSPGHRNITFALRKRKMTFTADLRFVCKYSRNYAIKIRTDSFLVSFVSGVYKAIDRFF